MNEPVTIRDVMTRSFVGVNESDRVAGVAQLMAGEQSDCAVVLRGTRAVGLLHATDIVGLVATEQDPTATPVRDVMQTSLTRISVDQPLVDAIDALATTDTRHVVITDADADDVVGVLSETDLVTAHLTIWHRDTDFREIMPVATTNHAGDATTRPDTMQGVCEICGSLTRQLTDQNGQFVCAECLAV